jgi:hypothetical protein
MKRTTIISGKEVKQRSRLGEVTAGETKPVNIQA